MNHFPEFDNQDNMGGNQRFLFIPITDIEILYLAVNQIVSTPPELKTDCSFFKGYASYKTLLFEEKQEQSAAGSYFNQKLSGFYPKINPTAIALFSEMQNQYFIVIVLDNNGQLRMVGNLEQPLKMRYSLSTGSNPATRNGVEYEFAGQSQFPAPFFSDTSFFEEQLSVVIS